VRLGIAVLLALGLALAACSGPAKRDQFSGEYEIVALSDAPDGLRETLSRAGTEAGLFVQRDAKQTYLLLTAGGQAPGMGVEVLEIHRLDAPGRNLRVLAVLRRRTGEGDPYVVLRLATAAAWTFSARLSTPGQGVMEIQGVTI